MSKIKHWYNIDIPARTENEKMRIENFKRYLKTNEIYYEASAMQDEYLHFEIYAENPDIINETLDKIIWQEYHKEKHHYDYARLPAE